MSLLTFQAILESSTLISPKVRHFVFRKQTDSDFHFIPGQFVTLHFPKDGKILKRSYSIATIPGKSSYIEFAANYVPGGPGTQLLFNLKPNDEITLSGPHGKLVLPEEQSPKRYLLMGTSTGITPYRSMLPQLEALLKQNIAVQIIQGVQTRNELLYEQDFLALTYQYEHFQFRAQYSKELPSTPLASHEFLGYVQTALEPLAPNPQEDLCFLCGNPNMIDETYQLLLTHGFNATQIRREKYFSR